ncbi:MAG: RsmB/NOP family class I SAM-dependent RNA methyltransferase [Deltaproteobacteria bacterium]|nr:RsmB/NOP family class I SAM-dependent RNA methyltransferase [Deltaproteobacteria bacterium]
MIEWPVSVSTLLTSVLAEPAKSEKALKRHFRAEAPTTNEYRRQVADTLLGTLCFKRRLEALLGDDEAIALACAYWWSVAKSEPPPGLLAFVPREKHERIQCAAQQSLPEESLEELAVAFSHPDWLVSSWAERISLEELRELLELQNKRAPVWVRFFDDEKDDSVSARQNIENAFLKEKVLAQPHEGVKSAFQLTPQNETLNIWGSPLWQAGAFEVQDLGSQIIVAALADVEGRVVDVCAGAGGKTLALAADRKKTLFASDVNKHALVNLKARFRRYGQESEQKDPGRSALNVEIRHGSPQLWQGEERFAAVLVDAPCSSTGTLRRGPARRWCIASEVPMEMARVQREVLHEAAELVEPGGVLLYATCSLQRIENEDVVEAFLRRHKSFSLDVFPFADDLRRFLERSVQLKAEDAMMTLWPHRAGTDGFFLARFRRRLSV